MIKTDDSQVGTWYKTHKINKHFSYGISGAYDMMYRGHCIKSADFAYFVRLILSTISLTPPIKL